MKAALKKKWVKALRSGKYAQARDALQTPEGFCCLGVLKEIEPTVRADCAAYLMESSCEITLKTQLRLAALNDGDITKQRRPKSFNYIASYIERYL